MHSLQFTCADYSRSWPYLFQGSYLNLTKSSSSQLMLSICTRYLKFSIKLIYIYIYIIYIYIYIIFICTRWVRENVSCEIEYFVLLKTHLLAACDSPIARTTGSAWPREGCIALTRFSSGVVRNGYVQYDSSRCRNALLRSAAGMEIPKPS